MNRCGLDAQYVGEIHGGNVFSIQSFHIISFYGDDRVYNKYNADLGRGSAWA